MPGRIFYLHGFASSPASKKARFFADRLAQCEQSTDVPDLSQGDFHGLTITGQLEVVERAAGGRPCLLIGSSLGGYLAALYAARHPEVTRLVLLAPAFGFARRWTATLGEDRVQEWKDTGSLSVYHYGDQAERTVGYRLLQDGQAYEDYPLVTQPCLVFHGRRDDVVPPAYSEEFAASHPNVTLHLLESDHQLLDVLDPIWRLVQPWVTV